MEGSNWSIRIQKCSRLAVKEPRASKAWFRMSVLMQYTRIFYKQGSTQQDKNLGNSITRQKNAKQFDHFSSDPIGNENRAAAIEKQVTEDISTPAHFCMQDTIYICCKKTCKIVF